MNLDTLKNTWAGWSTKKKAIVVIIVLAIIGGISSKKEENKSAPESAPVVQAPATVPEQPAVATQEAPKSSNVIPELVASFGPSGWAKCVSGQVAMSAMIVRGDPGVQQLKGPTDRAGEVLGAMRQNMLANNVPQASLDNLVRSWSSQIRSGDQAFDVLNQCITDMTKQGVSF
jgi:hypothetical protein